MCQPRTRRARAGAPGRSAPCAASKGLKLLAESSGLAVRSDRVLLGRILRNLLANAVRYTERGEVLLGAHLREGHVAIDVVDTGPGIPRGEQRAVFSEFVRLEVGEEPAGLGLGLSIVERMATLLGHGVSLESEVGAGSCFTVHAAREEGTAEQVIGSPVASASLEGRCVLVVDDDLEVLRAMREMLSAWGCRVVASACGAASGARSRPPC